MTFYILNYKITTSETFEAMTKEEMECINYIIFLVYSISSSVHML